MKSKKSFYSPSLKARENLMASAKLQSFALRGKKRKWAFLLRQRDPQGAPVFDLGSAARLRQQTPLQALSRSFAFHWQEKQALKSHYRIQRESQWRLRSRWARRGNPSQAIESSPHSQEKLRFLNLWESRLDTCLWKAHFFPSLASARQAILHGFATVNGCKVKKPSRKLQLEDFVQLNFDEERSRALREELSQRAFFQKAGKDLPLAKFRIQTPPEHLEVHYSSLSFVFSQEPQAQKLQWPYPLDLSYISLKG